jgi:hypothetical protein
MDKVGRDLTTIVKLWVNGSGTRVGVKRRVSWQG